MSLLYIHPIYVILVAGYILGLRQVCLGRSDPMWPPGKTQEIRVDQAGKESMTRSEILRPWLDFVLLACIVAVAGHRGTDCFAHKDKFPSAEKGQLASLTSAEWQMDVWLKSLPIEMKRAPCRRQNLTGLLWAR